MSFGKDDTQEQSQTTQPWEPAQGALKDILGHAGGLFSKGNAALGNRSVSSLYEPAQNTLKDLLSGNTLDVTKSPVWGSMVGGIQDAVNSQFSAAGRTGSPAHAGVMTSELGKLAGSLYGQERGRQLQGMAMAPAVYNFGNADLDSLWQNLSRYSSLASGIGGMGGTSNTTTKAPSNLLGDLLGTAAGIMGLGDMFGGGGDEAHNNLIYSAIGSGAV